MQFSTEQQTAIDDCDRNIYMSSGPGSGKSTTLAEIAKRLHNNEDNHIILITFTNKSARDILGKVGLTDSTRIRGGTFHSVAYRLMRESGVKTTICDENKKRLIIKKVFECRKDKEKFVEIYDKIGRTKSMYPRPACEVTRKYNEELIKYDMMDFDDIIHNGIEFVRNGNSKMTATHILVDELQDTSGAQLELLKVLRTTTNAKILGVGDLDQCQPKGTLVLTTRGYKDISELNPEKDKLPSYDGHGNICGLSDRYGYEFQIASRNFSGEMYTYNVDENIIKCTYNHKVYVKWNCDTSIYCVYLMQKGEKFRIGQCKMFDKNGYFHLGTRSRIEYADRTWILKTGTKIEMLKLETRLSIMYRIPMITFKEVYGNINFSQDVIDDIYNALDNEDLYNEATKLLRDYNKYIKYPFWESGNYNKRTSLTFIKIASCNVIHELMSMAVQKQVTDKTFTIMPIKSLTREKVKNVTVYSINVEPYHNYISSKLLISNSIYEWRGARPENVKEFIDYFGCKVYQLGLNFRSKSKIVEHSKRLIKFNKDRIEKNLRSNSVDRGIVQTYKAKDLYKEIDYIISYCKRNRDKEIAILYRTRLNKMKLEFELRKQGIKYKVNDSTDIVDRSAFRVILGMLRMSAGIYDIYDLEEVAKGMKALGKTAVEKVRAAQLVTKVAANGEQVDLFEKVVTTFDDLIHNIYHKTKGMRRPLGNILKLQDKFKELKGETMDQLIRMLPDYCTASFDIPEDILTFLIDITKEYSLTTSNIRELCNDFGLDKDNEKEDDDALIELSTIHGYKGSESNIVIIPFCDWNIRPDPNIKDVIASERRLFYVGITRPMTKLILTYSGTTKPRFIKEMGL